MTAVLNLRLVVSRATATLTQWQKVNYGKMPIDRGDRANVWVRDGDDLIQVEQIRGRAAATRLGGITLYDRAGGNLVSIVRAPHGKRVANGWEIGPATRFDVASGNLSQIGTVVVGRGSAHLDGRPSAHKLAVPVELNDLGRTLAGSGASFTLDAVVQGVDSRSFAVSHAHRLAGAV